jgi:hypothetical protein
VLNLAAGLDARPYRLDLPADLRWLHVDMPEMVDYFRTGMAGETPKCRLEFIPADLRDARSAAQCFAKARRRRPGVGDHRRASDLPGSQRRRRTRARPARHRARSAGG